MNRHRRTLAAAALAIALAGPLVPAFAVTAAAADVTFGTPTATFKYGVDVVFQQPVHLTSTPDRVEILIDFPGALGPNVTDVAPPGGGQTLTYTLAIADTHLLPNTPLKARWRVTTGGVVETGPDVSLLYADTGFAWRSLSGPLVRIHWYDGDQAFGQRALDIAEAGVRKAETTLAVTETAPIDFYVYAAQDAFYAALGPGTPEHVGGEEHSEIRTMFALITPSEVDASWVAEVLPHELTHLVFNTAVNNPYHFPPRWINEGLAVYLSRGYVSDDRAMVATAAAAGSLTPLAGLTGDFPAGQQGFYLAYAESVSAIDYLVRTYGQPALVTL
ncbi:MAG TPA: peptidase MA family metallohydrolase, partial [Candidatus Acidoferrum sp.]|nr:peptidase MA family metallohydrolase [Candidatus Acidoferrum sp.]